MEDLQATLRLLRLQRELSQDAVSALSALRGVRFHPSTLSRLEKGSAVLSAELSRALAAVYGVTEETIEAAYKRGMERTSRLALAGARQ